MYLNSAIYATKDINVNSGVINANVVGGCNVAPSTYFGCAPIAAGVNYVQVNGEVYATSTPTTDEEYIYPMMFSMGLVTNILTVMMEEIDNGTSITIGTSATGQKDCILSVDCMAPSLA